jgi:hypothetical protein
MINEREKLLLLELRCLFGWALRLPPELRLRVEVGQQLAHVFVLVLHWQWEALGTQHFQSIEFFVVWPWKIGWNFFNGRGAEGGRGEDEWAAAKKGHLCGEGDVCDALLEGAAEGGEDVELELRAEADGVAEVEVGEGEVVVLVAVGVEAQLGQPQSRQFNDLILLPGQIVEADQHWRLIPHQHFPALPLPSIGLPQIHFLPSLQILHLHESILDPGLMLLQPFLVLFRLFVPVASAVYPTGYICMSLSTGLRG